MRKTEQRVTFAAADAMGHAVSAEFLTREVAEAIARQIGVAFVRETATHVVAQTAAIEKQKAGKR